MFKVALILVLFFSVDLFSQTRPLYSPSAKGLNPKSYMIKAAGSYHPTNGIFNFNGEKTSLNGDESYLMTEGNVELGYGIGTKLDAFISTRFRQISSKHTNGGSTTLSATNSGVESFAGTVKYSFIPDDKIQWAMDFTYRQTSYEQKFFQSASDIPDTELVLGDAGQEYSFGVHTSYARNRGHYLNSILKYVVPANDLSDEINYRFESAWLWQRLGIILGVQGIQSLKKDNFTIDPQNKPLQATGSGGRFNSINREKVEPFLGINWAFNKWRLEGETGLTMSGVSVPNGQYFSLGFVYKTSGVTGDSFKIESFKEYVIEATVIKVSPRGKFLKIDQGISSDVEKGTKFDIFQTDYFGENILVASGVAYEVGADSAIVKILKKYKKIQIKKGFAARGY
ncbi:MAG: hypothetical protein CME70_14580 [Halobacteriovorax sp.]|nr:hypothetical protein [Halobacteriovorax sp.]|tara:strand:+ start:219054 stop:220244 length:1191 start_codon:yes stop_codon:yes gene_type:complete